MRHLLSLVPFVLLSAAAGQAATGDGVLSGSVRTRDGLPVPQLVLALGARRFERRAVTGPEGRYRFDAVPAGDYALTIDAPGFVLAGPGRVRLGAGEMLLDLVLDPAPVREHVVVAATRGEASLSTLGVSASALEREHIAERAASSVLDLLQELPGVSVSRTGALGAQGSAFIRGGASNAARVLLDGVPLNEPGGAYDFGQQIPLELERIEVVRGAAGSLYGSDALAGVIQLVTRKAGPQAPASARATLEGGGQDFQRVEAGSSGRLGRLRFNLGGTRLETNGPVANAGHEQTAWAGALDGSLGARTDLRLVLRGSRGVSGTPGPTAFGRPDRDASYHRDETVYAATLRHARGELVHEWRASHSQQDALSLDPLDSGSWVPSYQGRSAPFAVSDFPDPAGYQNASSRTLLGYQLEARAGSRHLVTAGLDAERESGAIGALSEELLRPSRDNLGAFVQDRVVVGGGAFLTLGGRVEKNGSHGTRAVPRAALALRLRGGDDATTLRASAGGGIKEPSFLESYGVSFYAQGNPALRPERSRTFDLGVEQRLLGSRLRAEATLFHHEYRDQIVYQLLDPASFQGSFVNLGRSRARGLELGVDVAPAAGIHILASYTLLDGRILASGDAFDPVLAAGQPLLRRPRHEASLSARAERGRIGIGATLLLVGRRSDSDFLGLGLSENPGHARLDARARAGLGRGFEAFVVAENLLDGRYQASLGYPASGRLVRVGLRFRSDARP